MNSNKLNTDNAIAEEQEVPAAGAAAQGQQEPVPAQPVSRWSAWKDAVERISYQGIVRNMPYLMFLTLLCIVYITNNNRAISLTRSINAKTKELKELHWRYLDIQSRLMYQTSETQLVPKAQAIGLKPLEKPAFEIKIKVPATEE